MAKSKQKKQPTRGESSVTNIDNEKQKDVDLLSSGKYWNGVRTEIEGEPCRTQWESIGMKTELLGIRGISRDASRSDPLNAVSAIASAQVSDILYNDPVPIARSKSGDLEPLESLWVKLLKYSARNNELVDQSNGKLFQYWGLVAMKIIPTPDGIEFYTVRGKDLLFDKAWMDNGGDPEERAYVIGEVIQMRLSDIRDNPEYNEEAVKLVLSKLTNVNKPAEHIITEVVEWHYRRADGTRMVNHAHGDSDILLLEGENTVGILPYTFMVSPGPRGLMPGPISEITYLDESTNKVLKRSMKLAAERGALATYNSGMIDEAQMKGAKDGLVLVKVKPTDADGMKNAVQVHKWGDLDDKDVFAVSMFKDLMQWATGVSPERLSGTSGEVTATETNYVAHLNTQKAAPWGRLADRYLDSAMRKAAIALKYMWDMGWYDVFADVLNQEEYQLFAKVCPSLSEDLNEFEIGVEPESTRHFKDREMVQAVMMFMETIPFWMQALEIYGEMIDFRVLFLRFVRALRIVPRPEDLTKPLPEEEGEDEYRDEGEEGVPGEEQMAAGAGGPGMLGPESSEGEVGLGRFLRQMG